MENFNFFAVCTLKVCLKNYKDQKYDLFKLTN